MKCKKLLSTILATAITISSFAAMSITANADGEMTTKKTMNFGTAVISAAAVNAKDRDIIYYGNQKKWRVLSKNGNTTNTDDFQETADATYTDDNGNDIKGPLFVISENDFGTRVFNTDNDQNWQGSEAQKWCKGDFYQAAGITTDTEKAAILTTSKTDSAITIDGWLGLKATSINDKVFYISAKEATTYFDGNVDRKFTADWWWLRSPAGSNSSSVAIVYDNGSFQSFPARNNVAASRPAFNINPESVIFTSAADFDGTVKEYTNKEWKLTLKDENRSGFEANYAGISEGKIKVSYSDAKTTVNNANEKISYIITDNNQTEIKYYGKKAATEESGSFEITLSDDFAITDRLFVFNEQDNGVKKTNYASEPVEITLPEFPKITVNVNGSNMGSVKSSAEKAWQGETVTLTATANEGYRFIGYICNDVDELLSDVKTGKGIFTMPDKDVTVTANFEPLEATHKITVISNYPQMGTASASVTTAKTGDVVTLSNTPENGNEFVEYISGDVNIEDGKFMMLDKDVTIIAKFKADAEFKDNTETPVQVQKNPDSTAILRFMWGIEMESGAYIKNIGAYIIPWDLFDKGSMSSPSMVIIKEPDIKNGDTFSADHIGIPYEKYNTEYCAIPFINGTLFAEAMLKGSVNQ